MWAARDSICLDCRTTLPADASCPGGKHRVTRLGDPGGRGRLLDTVWGPVSTRRRLREASRVAAIGSPGASLLDSCTGCDAMDLGEGAGNAILVLLVAFIAIVILWFATKLIVELVRRYRDRPRPNGAAQHGPRFARTFASGTVVEGAGAAIVEPITGRLAVAYGAELRARGRGVMLRDGVSAGFDVQLDTGERVRVPSGICVVDASRGERVMGAMSDYMATVDPLRGNADVEPFPGNDLRVAVIEPGSRVEIHSPLVPTPGVGETSYRDAAVILVPEGVARLRLVRG